MAETYVFARKSGGRLVEDATRMRVILQYVLKDIEEALGEWTGVNDTYVPNNLQPLKRAQDRINRTLAIVEKQEEPSEKVA